MEKQQNQNSELNLWWRETSKKKRETTCKILLEKIKKKKLEAFSAGWSRHTSRGMSVLGITLQETITLQIVSMERKKPTQAHNWLWFLDPPPFSQNPWEKKERKRKALPKRKKGVRKRVIPYDMPTTIMNSLGNQTHQTNASSSIDQINVPWDLQKPLTTTLNNLERLW